MQDVILFLNCVPWFFLVESAVLAVCGERMSVVVSMARANKG